MSRDLVLSLLVVAVCGSAIWLAGSIPSLRRRRDAGDAGRAGVALERRSWLRLWTPLLPGAIALAVLAGWAGQEPRQTDELLRPFSALLVAPVALVWLRAAWRAARALRIPTPPPLAATVGILRPRIVVHAELRRTLDRPALAAVLAHEGAHLRHRDPLRIWLAQLATDLQWPSAGARRRLDDWRRGLELARDEEARRDGVEGADLASAVVSTARLGRASRPTACAQLTGAEQELVERVQRLLAPLPADVVPAPSWPISLALAVALGVSALAGLQFGDVFIRALPLIVT